MKEFGKFEIIGSTMAIIVICTFFQSAIFSLVAVCIFIIIVLILIANRLITEKQTLSINQGTVAMALFCLAIILLFFKPTFFLVTLLAAVGSIFLGVPSKSTLGVIAAMLSFILVIFCFYIFILSGIGAVHG